MRVDLFCEEDENVHQCDGESKALGPIKLNPNSTDKSQDVFYFTSKMPLLTERYEFHKNKNSPVSDSSFIYMLQERRNLEINQLEPFLEQDEREMSTIDYLKAELLRDFDSKQNRNIN